MAHRPLKQWRKRRWSAPTAHWPICCPGRSFPALTVSRGHAKDTPNAPHAGLTRWRLDRATVGPRTTPTAYCSLAHRRRPPPLHARPSRPARVAAGGRCCRDPAGAVSPRGRAGADAQGSVAAGAPSVPPRCAQQHPRAAFNAHAWTAPGAVRQRADTHSSPHYMSSYVQEVAALETELQAAVRGAQLLLPRLLANRAARLRMPAPAASPRPAIVQAVDTCMQACSTQWKHQHQHTHAHRRACFLKSSRSCSAGVAPASGCAARTRRR